MEARLSSCLSSLLSELDGAAGGYIFRIDLSLLCPFSFSSAKLGSGRAANAQPTDPDPLRSSQIALAESFSSRFS